MNLPSLPTTFANFLPALKDAKTPFEIENYLRPYRKYEEKLRQIYAQQPTHPAVTSNHLVSVFANQDEIVNIRARDIAVESEEEKQHYLLPLPMEMRRKSGTPATVDGLKTFKTNFSIFSESSLADLDWSNVVAAGSSVVTPLLPVDPPHNATKRSLRSYYHEKLAPASDVDLFLYGLNEEQAIEKIKQIEEQIRNSILTETTTIRTKNAITIVSQYPTRHVQIVLRLYKSISEILTGFDVDCSCVAYDGSQVWASPRAIGAFATQTNNIDLTRRSPSYENRLSKYSHRGFEVYWPILERSRIDPTIFERSFGRVVGLARLLVLEKLPHPQDRDDYSAKRREERGRPPQASNARYQNKLQGNVKDAQPDDVAEWVEEDDVSNYHSFTIPYGPRYTAKKVEKLLYKKDLLLNAEWNRPDQRKTSLHRHPAFFGSVEDVIHDCCGHCPEPITDDDIAIFQEERKTFITGEMTFLKDDPGRQSIGSFNPITDKDWTEMAYIGNTAVLCQAIVDQDLEGVIDWFSETESDANRRDHTGRTPLQLASSCSSVEIVQCLIDRGARIVSRLYNGMTALHLAAHRGDADIVKALLDKSEANQAEETLKEEMRKTTRKNAVAELENDSPMAERSESSSEDSEDMVDSDDDVQDDMTDGSFIKVRGNDAENLTPQVEDNPDEPDFYDVDIVAWDNPVSPLHLAVMAGNLEVIDLLINTYGADVMLPVKVMSNSIPRHQQATILPLLLSFDLPLMEMNQTIKILLSSGAVSSQTDTNGISALHYTVSAAKNAVLEIFRVERASEVTNIIDQLVIDGWPSYFTATCPLITAIKKGSLKLSRQVLTMGASPTIAPDTFARAYNSRFKNHRTDEEEDTKLYQQKVEQPIIQAARQECMWEFVNDLVDRGVDVNSLPTGAYTYIAGNTTSGESKSLLDIVSDRRKYLEDYTDEKSKATDESLIKPVGLEADDYYLTNLPANTYQHWVASNDLASAKFIQYQQVLLYEKATKQAEGEEELLGEEQKKKSIEDLASKLTVLEQKLVGLGAKTFYDIHPDLERPKEIDTDHSPWYYTMKSDPYQTEFKFLVSDVNTSKRKRYMPLFEAVYVGDSEKVRQLCLCHIHGVPPLQVAVRDNAGFSPFSIAMLRGHQQLAELILEIAAAQYQPPNPSQRFNFTSSSGITFDDVEERSEDDEFGDEEAEPQVIEDFDLTDQLEPFDFDNAASSIKSKDNPACLISWDAEIWRVSGVDPVDAKNKLMPSKLDTEISVHVTDAKKPWAWFHECLSRERMRSRWSLIRYAILQNDGAMLEFLLQKQLKYAVGDNENVLENATEVNIRDIEFAMHLGRTEMLGELVRKRGILMPLHKMVERSGIKLDGNPKYYQGLSVHGQKRKDWADAGRNQNRINKSDQGAPLLTAVMYGNVDVIEYFLSDGPLRRYREFVTEFKEDKRIQALAKGEGGIDAALNDWIRTRAELVLHIAVLSNPWDCATRLRFLLGRIPPKFLDKKCSTGDTPLQLAFQLKNYVAAELLIAAGANQYVRNNEGNNILHIIYANIPASHPGVLRMLVSMLDQQAVQKLLSERTSSQSVTSLTPLALYLDSSSPPDIKLTEAMLDISNGLDLEIMDGAGDYPLHNLIRKNNIEAAKLIARRRPHLMYWENATGMTPIEVLEARYLRSKIDNPLRIQTEPKDESIRDKPAKEFLLSKVDEKEQEDDTFHTFRSMIKENPGKRKLVSLLDANEIAKRLAIRQQKRNEEMHQREAQGLNLLVDRYLTSVETAQKRVQADEVSQWMSKGLARMSKIDWIWNVEKLDVEGVDSRMQILKNIAEGRKDDKLHGEGDYETS